MINYHGSIYPHLYKLVNFPVAHVDDCAIEFEWLVGSFSVQSRIWEIKGKMVQDACNHSINGSLLSNTVYI